MFRFWHLLKTRMQCIVDLLMDLVAYSYLLPSRQTRHSPEAFQRGSVQMLTMHRIFCLGQLEEAREKGEVDADVAHIRF